MLKWLTNFITWLFKTKPVVSINLRSKFYGKIKGGPLADIHDKTLMVIAEQVSQQGLVRAELPDIQVKLLDTTINFFDGPMKYIREDHTIYINRSMPLFMRSVVKQRPGLSPADITLIHLAYEIGEIKFDKFEYNMLQKKLSMYEDKYQWAIKKESAIRWLEARRNIHARMLYVIAENGREYIERHDPHLTALFEEICNVHKQDQMIYFDKLKVTVSDLFDEAQ